MSGEHTHCPHCGDDLCQVDCRDALLDRIANYGIDLIAKDRHIAEVASENGRLGLQVEIDKERIAELEAQACEMKIYMGTLEKENERLTKRELFAAMAMQGLVARGYNSKMTGDAKYKPIATEALLHADALIAELEKEGDDE